MKGIDGGYKLSELLFGRGGSADAIVNVAAVELRLTNAKIKPFREGRQNLLREDVSIHRTNLKYCGKSPKIRFPPTFIFCSPIFSNNCGVVFL